MPGPDAGPSVSRRKVLEYWWALPVAGTLGAFAWMFDYAARVTFGKVRPGEPQFQSGPRVRVASVADLPEANATVNFTYDRVACVLWRLPEAAPHAVRAGGGHFVAFSRVCTHLGCLVEPLRDPEATALTYNYRTDHAVLGCPCHFSVFDPFEGGASVFGKALYPLPRVRLEARGGVLYATGIEAPPKKG